MYLALRQTGQSPKVNILIKTEPVRKPRQITEQEIQADQDFEVQKQQGFNLSVTQRNQQSHHQTRMIKRSMINRSCINTLSFCCKSLDIIPPELSTKDSTKLGHIQKLDLSYNYIYDIRCIPFPLLQSLKELLLNDNAIEELPYKQINKCKGLKLLNFNNNHIHIIQPLTRVSYIQAKNNPIRLITSELLKLTHIQFLTLDWMEYLIDYSCHPTHDRFKDYTSQYNLFKVNILQKIDYSKEDNRSYCDFHCYFSIRMKEEGKKKQRGDSFFTQIIVKCLYKSDPFFIKYLKDFQNNLNYARMTYNSKLLLEYALENNHKEAIQLFKLKKDNYVQNIDDQLYFQTLRVSCRYSNYEMFSFLIHIHEQRKKITTKSHTSLLIREILNKYQKDKDSQNILLELVKIYKEVSNSKYLISIPHQYNSKIYKSLSLALLEIYQNQSLKPYFQVDSEGGNVRPLHFVMKSRNQELLKEFLDEGWDVFQRNQNRTTCKFTHGSTQVSRKMIWKAQKRLIKKYWKESARSSNISKSRCKTESNHSRKKCSRLQIAAELQQQFQSYKKQQRDSLGTFRKLKQQKLGQSRRKCYIQDQLLPCLYIRTKQIVNISWQMHYARKMLSINIFINLLQQLPRFKENSLLKRLELWKKIMDRLSFIYEAVQKQTPLLQYQICQSSELVNRSKEDRCQPYIKVQRQRVGNEHHSFWCCQNIAYQP